MKNWSYKITEGEHAGETLWSGRYCCVAGFIFRYSIEPFKLEILATKRSNKCPDFQGYVCCPCGFLEADETGEEGCVREIREETGYIINPKLLILDKAETDPAVCNKGHVTLIYSSVLLQDEFSYETPSMGEECDWVKWIDVKDIDKYDWAFGHDRILKEMLMELGYDNEDDNDLDLYL